MLTPAQVEKLVRFFVNEIVKLIEGTDIELDKDKQRLLLGIDELFNDLDIGLADHIPETLFKRYIEGIQQAESSLEGLGMSIGTNANTDANRLVKAPLHKEAITNIVTDTMTDLAAATRTAKVYTNKNVDNAINDVKTELANGMISGMTTKAISKRVAQKFADQNMTAFVTVDGKHLPLDFYAKTVTRTKMRTAENHGTLNRYKDRKVKHVYVAGNVPTCAECARYRGIVFATERDDTFPHINLHTTFPLHPNCECNFRPWIMKFKSKQEIDQAKDKAKTFNPDVDPRTQKERDKYNDEQKRKQRARRKQLTYNKMKLKLGKEGPQSYADYMNAFNNDKPEYHTWVAMMKGIYKSKDTPFNDDNEQSNADEQENSIIEEVIEKIDYKALDYTTPDDFDDISNDYAQKIFDRMSDEEKEAINAYTYDEYLGINRYIRDKTNGMLQSNEVTKHPEELGYIKDFAESMEDMFDKYDVRLQDNVTFYRGVSEKEMADISRKIDFDENDEMIYTLDNFKSVTSSRDEIDFFLDDGAGWTFIIKAPKDSRVLSLQKLSGMPSEREYLIQNGKQFEIANIDEMRRIVEVYLR